MRDLHDIARHYGTDKVESGYLAAYERYFGAWRERPVALLELGVLRGASLLTWQEYFPSGRIVGLDRKPVQFEGAEERIRIYQGDQQDTALLDRIAAENAPAGFDIVIDDAAHIGTLARASFWHLFERHLKPGGVYVVEDWGTGYWRDWPDGVRYRPRMSRLRARLAGLDPEFSAHNFGMVGFIKELVDESARGDITHARGAPPQQQSRFDELILRTGQAFIRKPLDGRAQPQG